MSGLMRSSGFPVHLSFIFFLSLSFFLNSFSFSPLRKLLAQIKGPMLHEQCGICGMRCYDTVSHYYVVQAWDRKFDSRLNHICELSLTDVFCSSLTTRAFLQVLQFSSLRHNQHLSWMLCVVKSECSGSGCERTSQKSQIRRVIVVKLYDLTTCGFDVVFFFLQ